MPCLRRRTRRKEWPLSSGSGRRNFSIGELAFRMDPRDGSLNASTVLALASFGPKWSTPRPAQTLVSRPSAPPDLILDLIRGLRAKSRDPRAIDCWWVRSVNASVGSRWLRSSMHRLGPVGFVLQCIGWVPLASFRQWIGWVPLASFRQDTGVMPVGFVPPRHRAVSVGLRTWTMRSKPAIEIRGTIAAWHDRPALR